jgi:hypothetical protein
MIAWCPPGYGHSRSVERVIDRQSTTRDAHLAIHLMQVSTTHTRYAILQYSQHLSLTPFTSIGWSEGGRTALNIAHIGRHVVTAIVECGAAVYVHEKGYRLFNCKKLVFSFVICDIQPQRTHFGHLLVEESLI